MKHDFRILAIGLTLFVLSMFAGCFFITNNAPKVTAPVGDKTSPTAPYHTGGLLGPMPKLMAFGDHPTGKRLMAAPLAQSGGVLPQNRCPVLYQQGNGCGPCQVAAVAFPATHQTFSPAFVYTLSRQLAGTFPADTGTYTIYNLNIAQNKGQPRLSVWAYWQEDINAIPSAAAIADAANYKLVATATPDINSVEAALAGGNAVGLYISATSDVYYPTKLADGSFEILTPTPTSTRIGGHFWTAVWYDNTRKMMDGTTGGIECENSWGTNYGQAGFVWVSISGWVTNATNGNLSQAYTFLPTSPPLPALTFTGNFPTTLHASQQLNVTWQSNGDSVTVTDTLWHFKGTYPANGSFLTGVSAPDVWSFTSTRASDSATIVKTVSVSP